MVRSRLVLSLAFIVVAGCSLRSLDELTQGAAPIAAAGAGDFTSADAGRAGAATQSGGAGGKGAASGTESGGAGGSAGAPSLEPDFIGCTAEEKGHTRCAGQAQDGVLRCDGARWVLDAALSCEFGQLCDSGAPPTTVNRCKSPVAECIGRTPGSIVCGAAGTAGVPRLRCGVDLVSTELLTTCADRAQCLNGSGATCAVCFDGEFRCSGAQLEECKADFSGFALKETCKTVALCNAGAGACTTSTCIADSVRCTAAGVLEKCNAGETAWEFTTNCGAGLCDAKGGQCFQCVSGDKRCAKGAVESCVGGFWQSSSCGTGLTCVGAGVCQCVDEPSSTTCSGKCGTQTNNCGKSVSCSTCCAPDSTTCTGKCGTVTNNCGQQVACGGCGTDQTCSGNSCTCNPISCGLYDCGTVSNACGSANCGGCPVNYTCVGNTCEYLDPCYAAYLPGGAALPPACQYK